MEYVAWESNMFTVECFDTLAKIYNCRLKKSGQPRLVKVANGIRDAHINTLGTRVRPCAAFRSVARLVEEQRRVLSIKIVAILYPKGRKLS